MLLERIAVTDEEAAARRDLRAQIARLEARGAAAPARDRGPRLLGLAELEATRDALLTRTSTAPRHDGARRTFEAMCADPRGHKWRRMRRDQLGVPGCGEYRVVPRLGIIGMMAGWWHITLSSGCP